MIKSNQICLKKKFLKNRKWLKNPEKNYQQNKKNEGYIKFEKNSQKFAKKQKIQDAIFRA